MVFSCGVKEPCGKLLAAHLNGEHLVAEGAFNILAATLKIYIGYPPRVHTVYALYTSIDISYAHSTVYKCRARGLHCTIYICLHCSKLHC